MSEASRAAASTISRDAASARAMWPRATASRDAAEKAPSPAACLASR
jgi:hypothetical protein